jgi:transposase
MPRGKELDPQMCGRILELRSLGWSFAKIVTKHNLPCATVQYTIKQAQIRSEKQESLPRTRRPRVITKEQRDSLFERVELTPEISYAALQAQECPNASIRSIQKLLQEIGIRKWVRLKRPLLNEDQAAARLN